MYTNPYEPPKVQATQHATLNHDRQAAIHRFRIAMLILLVPATYNFVCFNFPTNGNNIEQSIHAFYRATNFFGLILTVAAVWLFGLAILEFGTGVTHSIIARKSKLSEWKKSLYLMLRRTPYFSVPGAALWAFWVFAFYQLELGFYTVSVLVGIAAHALAACLYIPLIWSWYKMEHFSARQ